MRNRLPADRLVSGNSPWEAANKVCWVTPEPRRGSGPQVASDPHVAGEVRVGVDEEDLLVEAGNASEAR